MSSVMLLLASTMLVTPVNALGFTNSNLLIENFNNFEIKAESEDAPLYGIVWGDEGRVEGRQNFPASIVDYQNQFNGYTGLTLSPADSNGETFFLAELADINTGFDRPDTDYWYPENGGKVVLRARMKLSDDYANGTAVGSAGIWLWNSPFCFTCEQDYIPAESIGFSWNGFDSALPGFHLDVVQGNYPVYYSPQDFDYTSWNNYKLVWMADEQGAQSVEYYINGDLVGSTDLTTPLSPLNLEMWVDNQYYAYDGSIAYQSVPDEQQMLIDFVSVREVN